MSRTFADEIVETSTTQGTVTYQLGGAKGSYRRFRAGYDDGEDKIYYGVRNALKTKWELHRKAELTYGSPDTLTRNVFLSTNGNAAVNWTADDLPLTIYVPSAADVLEMVITGGLSAARHALVRAGAFFWKYSDVAVSWRRYLAIGDDDGEEVGVGTYDVVKAAYFEDGRRPWTAIGAANKVVAAADIGGVFTFNNSAAERTFTLPAHGDAGVGHGFKVGGLGLTGAGGYAIVVTPAAGDGIEGGADGVARRIPGGVRFDIEWDDPSDTWRIVWLNTTPLLAGFRRQAVVSGPVDGTTGLPTLLPSTNGSLAISTQNVSVTAPIIASAAQGFGLAGPIDVVGYSATNLNWTGLTASRAAATPNFLYGTIAGGIITPASTIVEPVYKWSGAPAVTAGLITFVVSEMKAYLGNGTTAVATALVLFGEAATDGSGVISTVAYAYNGQYDTGWLTGLPTATTLTSKNANLGIAPEFYKAEFMIKNTSTEGGYNAGDTTDDVNFATAGSQFGKMTVSKTRNVIRTTTGSNGYLIVNLSSGALHQPDVSKWDHRMTATRRF